jgi:hypothetical protein
MEIKRNITNIMLGCLLFGFGQTVGAIPLTDPSVFGADATTVTFDEMPLTNGQTITTDFSSYGVSFSPNVVAETYRSGVSGFSGQNVANFEPIVNPFSINFDSVVDAAGAFWEFDVGNVATFEAFLNGSLVDSFNYTEDDCCVSGTYLGFQDVTFDSILVSITNTQLMIMDNLSYSSAVPEPSSLLLMGIGLAGFGFARRKKKVH